MKKKTVKKLVLAKETVRSLEVTTLIKVAGGSPTDEVASCIICYEEPISVAGEC
jgi:hypothetical protein